MAERSWLTILLPPRSLFATGLDLRTLSPRVFTRTTKMLCFPLLSKVDWAVAYPGDQVSTDMTAHPDRFHQFPAGVHGRVIRIFRRLPSGTTQLAGKEKKTGPHLAIGAAPTSNSPCVYRAAAGKFPLHLWPCYRG